MINCRLDRGFLSVKFLEVQLWGVSVTYCCVTITNLVALNTINHDFTVFVRWESWLDLPFRTSLGCNQSVGWAVSFLKLRILFQVDIIVGRWWWQDEGTCFLDGCPLAGCPALDIACSSLSYDSLLNIMAVYFIKASRESL